MPVEDVDLKKAEDVIEGSGQAFGELDVGDDEIDREGDQELREDSVPAGTEETFDPKMLIHSK